MSQCSPGPASTSRPGAKTYRTDPNQTVNGGAFGIKMRPPPFVTECRHRSDDRL
ncbi:hypothetical protein BZL30_5312 [Mycobacterium kansasii]|uniref:Uncharacterized protein n=1 Tax=Mycobacterium kansasii TaxID=1768 RepID=A0A1V3WZF3_MYCKA|nr:hypothetical protein BZL30_5312 [Mycobacterium kansasii]